jgi:hypothetical protein
MDLKLILDVFDGDLEKETMNQVQMFSIMWERDQKISR